jgi:hypothetical protein
MQYVYFKIIHIMPKEFICIGSGWWYMAGTQEAEIGSWFEANLGKWAKLG